GPLRTRHRPVRRGGAPPSVHALLPGRLSRRRAPRRDHDRHQRALPADGDRAHPRPLRRGPPARRRLLARCRLPRRGGGAAPGAARAPRRGLVPGRAPRREHGRGGRGPRRERSGAGRRGRARRPGRHRVHQRHDPSSLKSVLLGGAPSSPELIRRVRDTLGVEVSVRYSSTEVAIATASLPDDPPERLATTVGKPTPGVELRIVDERNAPVPAGTAGEVVVRSPAAMVRYWRDPEATAATI